MTARLASRQARALRRTFLVQGLAAVVVYTLAFALLAVTAFPAVYQNAAYAFADLVAPWSYVDAATYAELQQQTPEYVQLFGDADADATGGAAAGEGASSSGDASSEGATAGDPATAGNPAAEAGAAGGASSADGAAAGEDMAPGSRSTSKADLSSSSDLGFWTDGALYAVRDLSGYHAFLAAGGEVAVALYGAGLVAIALVFVHRALARLDELSRAITGLFADRLAPIDLPDDLADARAELVEVQNRALADERAAKAAETRKNELVAYLAHDIRTPLTSIIGYLSILAETPELPARDRERFTSVALGKAERLEDLVSEFFEITRYDLQAIPIERERVDLGLFCRQIADELYPEAEAKGVSIDVAAPDGVSAFVDPDKMARAVSNVAKNAVAFAEPHTTVTLRAASDARSVTIEVCDRGKEISAEHLETIFEKFFREDASRRSSKGGAGLGLAIAREIVEAHGGSISARSSEGETVFSIALSA